MKNNDPIKAVERWLDNTVIGFNLCPFASKPRRQNQIRIINNDARNETDILAALYEELCYLTENPQTSTTLLILQYGLNNFDDYNQFLQAADDLLIEYNWQGVFQIASFHPDYQFGGTQPDDNENLTNRSPYPILHILREDELEKALMDYPHPEKIPARNIARMEQLSSEEIATLFPYLDTKKVRP
ncbi:DUF1415 domain-containing protein [Neptunicella sp.]|uniref:DUF1415 domain-containing protein n=1 Tax=Neptunicella sp. TaxID=2125986 RepID=UPI003F68C183